MIITRISSVELGAQLACIIAILIALCLIFRWTWNNSTNWKYALPEIIWVLHTLIFRIVIMCRFLGYLSGEAWVGSVMADWSSIVAIHGVMMIGIYYIVLRRGGKHE